MTVDDTNLTLVVTLRYWQEDDCWVGRCDELGVSTFDQSLDTLVEELQEMAEDHISLLEETGILEDFFDRFGIKPEPDSTTSRTFELAVNSTSDLVQFYKLSIGQPAHAV